MTERDERFRGRDSSSERRANVFAVSHDHATNDDGGYYSKGTTVKSRYSAGNATGTDDVSQRTHSKKSPRSQTLQ